MIVTTTTEDAYGNYLKNRGEPGQWFQHKADYIEDKPIPRIRNGGIEIVEKNKSIIGDLLIHDQRRPASTDDIHVRLTTLDAKKIADKYNFQADKWFDFPGNLNYKPPKAPRKLYTETAKEIAENIWHYKSHDWYKQNRPQTTDDVKRVNKCFGTVAMDIQTKMQSSHADEWFRTWSYKDTKMPNTAPNSPKSRVKPEAMEYANRAKGIGLELTRHSNKYDREYDDEALPYRCNTAEAAVICRQQTKGQAMSKCMGTSSSRSTGSSNQYRDRVHDDDAREYLNRNRSGTMNLAVEGNSVTICQPRVRPEAEEYYSKGQGVLGSVMNQNENKEYSSPKPAPRIRTNEAQQAADVNKGVMDTFLSNPEYRHAKYPPKIQARAAVGPDAGEIVQKSLGSSMRQILEEYGKKHESSQRKLTKTYVTEDGPEPRSGMQDVLVHTNKRIPPEIPPLRISGAGYENLEKHRGGNFFKTIQQRPPTK